MVIHKDSIDQSVLNQFKSIFQTVINSNKINFNSNVFRYLIEIESKNQKSAKLTLYVN